MGGGEGGGEHDMLMLRSLYDALGFRYDGKRYKKRYVIKAI